MPSATAWSVRCSLLVVILIFWAIIHLTAEPGCQISYLWGLVKYQKRHARQKQRKSRQLEIIIDDLQMVFRTITKLGYWIDSDISHFGFEHIDSLLSGPYHLPCQHDLNYFDPDIEPRYRIARKCVVCETEVLPKKSLRDDTQFYKQQVLLAVQRLYFSKGKLKSPIHI